MNKEIILNEEQKEALEQIRLFLENESLRIFILKGYAGTGKTTLLKKVIDNFGTKYKFELSATTGAASKILSKKTNASVNTIHNKIYGFNKIEEKKSDEFTYSFIDKKESKNTNKKVYIIDEASMIGNNTSNQDTRVSFGSNKLLNDLLEKSKDYSNKFMFIGDPMQLPPVGSDTSTALDKKILEDFFNVKCKEFTLKKIMRQANENTIQGESIKLREAFKNRELYTLTADNRNIFYINYDDIPEFYCKNKINTGIITHTNKGSLILSQNIRKRLFKNIDKKINVGEKLLVILNNHKIGVMNGNIIKIIKIIEELNPIEVVLEQEERKVIKLEFIKATIEKEDKTIVTTYILLNFLNDFLYPKDEKYISDALTKLAISKGEDPYNSILCNALRVRYGYSITCHKAQGNEFDNVILENKNINNDFDYKWLYTGITRAKNKIYIFNNNTLNKEFEDDFYKENICETTTINITKEKYLKESNYIIELIKPTIKEKTKETDYIIELI